MGNELKNQDLKSKKEKCKKEILEVVKSVFEKTAKESIFAPVVQYGWGVGQFRGLFWWKVKINKGILKEPFQSKGYDYICFVPYIIDSEQCNTLFEKDDSDCSQNKYIINRNVADSKNNGIYWGRITDKDKNPHLDSTTGNIHIDFDVDNWDGKIHQLTLVRDIPKAHYGPLIEKNKKFDSEDTEMLYFYKNKDKSEYVVVPKDCYYPHLFEKNEIPPEGTTLKELLEGMIYNVGVPQLERLWRETI